MRCDVAEVFLGGFLGGAVGAGIVSIGSSHDSTSWGITLAAIAGIVTVFSGFGVRGQLRRPSINPIRLLTVGSVAVVAAFVAFQPFRLWSEGVIAGKHTADLLAVSTAALGTAVAWWLASSVERRASRDSARGSG
jgi:drug/metabolite transporter (DMT)-like permease